MGVDDLIDLCHQADGLVQGDDDAMVVVDVVRGDRAVFEPFLEPELGSWLESWPLSSRPILQSRCDFPAWIVSPFYALKFPRILSERR